MDLPAGADRPTAGRPLDPCAARPKVVPIECVVRGYLAGSGWKEYQQERHGLRHPTAAGPDRERPAARADLHAVDQGRRPGTTRTSRSSGWWSWSGRELAEELRRRSLRIFQRGLGVRPAARHYHRRHEVRVRPGGRTN